MATVSSGGDTAATPQWSSRFAFIMAAVGSAVGLGNVWKFPYLAGENGGSAFVLVYLGCVFLIAIPILASELILGRLGRHGPVRTMVDLGRRFGRNPGWGFVGVMGVVAALLILSFYSVIAGWAVAYIPKLAAGDFTGATGDQSGAIFGSLLADPGTLILWQTLFVVATVVIVARGVIAGIERAVTWLMPALFVMLVLLVIYAAIEGDMSAALDYMFKADFTKISADVVLAAVGQAFFSLSIGLGGMMAYGAYLDDDVSIPQTTAIVALADTACATLAGLAIFPIVFAIGLDPAQGPGLVFVTLPVAFGGIPLGSIFGTIFFVLLTIAAITSSVALLEPVVASVKEHVKLSRPVVATIIGVIAWVIGLATVFSFNIWAEFKPIGGKTLFDLIDYVTANVMLPLGGALIAIFTGWIVAREVRVKEFGLGESPIYQMWLVLVRWVAPIAVLVVAAANLGLF